MVGDGEAETGPLATSWHSNKFLNPATDGAVLPILHLNGYKIANPCVLARISMKSWISSFAGYGYTPYFVEGDDPKKMHQLMAATLDRVIAEIQQIQTAAEPAAREARRSQAAALADDCSYARRRDGRVRKEIDGKRTKGYWRSHQVPMGEMHNNPAHVKILEQWMKSYQT